MVNLRYKIHKAQCQAPTFLKDAEPVFVEAYLSVYAPPAWHLLHDLHFQIPTACRFTENCSHSMACLVRCQPSQLPKNKIEYILL